jgi:hypothetical protein
VVRDRHGHQVGRIEELLFDNDTAILQGFVVRAGGAMQTFLRGGHTRLVVVSDVEEAGTDKVVLRLNKQELTGTSDQAL